MLLNLAQSCKNIGSLHRTNYLIKEDKTTTLPNSGVYELLIVPMK